MEESLIHRAKNGNEHAFRLLIEMYKDYVFKSIYGVLRNQKDAEDASQEVWIKIYTSLPSYEGQGFKTWISRIAVRHAIDCKRKKARRSEELVDEFAISIDTDSRSSHLVERSVLLKEQKQLVLKCLEQAPAAYRDVIEGYYIKEKTYQQLAEEHNVQVKTIETKLYRARSWIRKHWKEEDFL
ncbi:sigma-70 family RNA polymerase sigma factor [Bacillus sp. NTK071]|uniref:sigma-70 family RNA polymerase sigma factor n=1 Tax=Bacillus sp. NTK071 TaxID=2802175 RepID=UPI001A8D9162|nr:sigma-70 family RNA polymerase sigma factor [Bacillus sp. NTK071]MBN8210522.1 sigma-70 family RNA polymerase sigma factor [Bacillus sp. NTK071]